MDAGTRPLEDVRILAVEQYGAGPWATLQLSDLGAEIIKVEDPNVGGDVGRYVPPFQDGEDSLFFETFNRSKRSIGLDLRTAGGERVFRDLARHVDAVFCNLRGDVPEQLGLTYGSLSSVNPAIVCCSLSAYGMNGPRAAAPGYDYILQGLAGWMTLTGEPDSPPTKSGLSLVDYSGGFVAAISLLAGIHQARRTGVGMDCDVSLFDSAISLLTYIGTWAMSRSYEPQRTRLSAHPSLFPFQAFKTSDGWIMVACAKEKFWERLVVALDLEYLAEDPRCSDFAQRLTHSQELNSLIGERFATKTSAEWLQLLGQAGVPSGPINTVSQALAEDDIKARGLVVRYEHPRLGWIGAPATAVRVGDYRPPAVSGPGLGEHTDDLLEGLLGYTNSEISELRSEGAFG